MSTGDDRIDAGEDEIEDLSTSGVSTVNSVKMKSIAKDDKYICDEFSRLKIENVRLMQDLLESHQQYQALLKATIDEQRLNLDLLKSFTSQLTNVSTIYKRSISQGLALTNFDFYIKRSLAYCHVNKCNLDILAIQVN